MIAMDAEIALAKDRNPANRKRRVRDRIQAEIYRIERRLQYALDGRNAIEATQADRTRRDLLLERLDRLESINV